MRGQRQDPKRFRRPGAGGRPAARSASGGQVSGIPKTGRSFHSVQSDLIAGFGEHFSVEGIVVVAFEGVVIVRIFLDRGLQRKESET